MSSNEPVAGIYKAISDDNLDTEPDPNENKGLPDIDKANSESSNAANFPLRDYQLFNNNNSSLSFGYARAIVDPNNLIQN